MAYEVSKEFWAVLAARLAFVIVFQVTHRHTHSLTYTVTQYTHICSPENLTPILAQHRQMLT